VVAGPQQVSPGQHGRVGRRHWLVAALAVLVVVGQLAHPGQVRGVGRVAGVADRHVNGRGALRPAGPRRRQGLALGDDLAEFAAQDGGELTIGTALLDQSLGDVDVAGAAVEDFGFGGADGGEHRPGADLRVGGEDASANEVHARRNLGRGRSECRRRGRSKRRLVGVGGLLVELHAAGDDQGEGGETETAHDDSLAGNRCHGRAIASARERVQRGRDGQSQNGP